MQWNRKLIKDRAKAELKISYWMSLLVCFVGGILGGGSSSGVSFSTSSFSGLFDALGQNSGTYRSNFTGALSAMSYHGGYRRYSAGMDSAVIAVILVVVIIFLIVMLFALAFQAFVGNPVLVGKASFFVRAPYGDRRFGNLFSAFGSGKYLSTVKSMFITSMCLLGWYLLFFIPGVVKSYEYRMVPYLLTDMPHLTSREARELSRRMTEGEKWNLFVLDLSFIGWYLLPSVPFLLFIIYAVFVILTESIVGIVMMVPFAIIVMLIAALGGLFIAPYVEATWAQLYLIMRQKIAPPRNEYGSGQGGYGGGHSPQQTGPGYGPYGGYQEPGTGGGQSWGPYGQPQQPNDRQQPPHFGDPPTQGF